MRPAKDLSNKSHAHCNETLVSIMLKRRSSYFQTNNQDFFYDKYLSEFLVRSIGDIIPRNCDHKFLVLDIGCGEQPLRSIVEGYGATYMSADITQNRTASVDFLVDITSPNVSKIIPERYDLILLSEVLEHVQSPYLAMLNVKHLLKHNGRALVTTPFVWPLHEQPLDYQRLTSFWFEKHVPLVGLHIEIQECLGSPIDVLSTILLKTHVYAVGTSSFRALLSRLYALLTRSSISWLVFILSKHVVFSAKSSSSFYLINCLVLTCKSANG